MTPRPRKTRIVHKKPYISQFSPRGRRGRPGYLEVKLEEFEAIRLSDKLGLSQKDSSRFMGISQQTFSRVLKNGRRCLADGLVRGLIIRVKGGDYKIEK